MISHIYDIIYDIYLYYYVLWFMISSMIITYIIITTIPSPNIRDDENIKKTIMYNLKYMERI